MAGKLVKLNLGDQATREIKDRIISLEFAPGERLVIDGLSESLGVSITPVRDALRELVNHGLVTYTNGNYKVVKYSTREIGCLFDIRASLEALAARLAAKRMDNDNLDSLQKMLTQAEVALEGEDVSLVTNIDIRFHETISECSDNVYLLEMLRNLREKSWLIRKWVFGDHIYKEEEKQAIGEHGLILKSLVRRDGTSASRSMEEHLLKAKDRTLVSYHKRFEKDRTFEH